MTGQELGCEAVERQWAGRGVGVGEQREMVERGYFVHEYLTLT
jgi:hypothetical protein